ncbi:MAG: protocatechuate 3,4-dioxygenase subunit alpha [Kineosporiaceae bacterium]
MSGRRDTAGPRPSPGQTVGPFHGFALPWPGGEHLVPPGSPGSMPLTGRVLDGAGAGVTDALVEIWQADTAGRVPRRAGSLHRDGHTFTGFGRAPTDGTGRFSFTTVRPGAVGGGLPFIAVVVLARGLLDRLVTRAYLPAPEAALAADPFLATLGAGRRATLVAVEDGPGLRFDVRLQGEGETVFLDFAGHPADRGDGGDRGDLGAGA